VLIHVHVGGERRAMSLAEFEEEVCAGTIGPETPIAWVGRSAEELVPARELPAWREAWDSPAARVRRALANPPVPWATALVVGIPWRIHAWVVGRERDAWEAALVKLPAAITERGEAWRVVSYALLHGDVGHALSNLLFLALCGVVLETIVGPWGLLGLFTVSVAAGGLLSTLGSDTPALGASAADFGFLAATAIAGWRYGDLAPRRLRPLLGGIMAVYLVQALWNGLHDTHVDNLAHLGGALAGGALMAALRPDAILAWRRRNRMAIVAALTACAVTTWGLVDGPAPRVAVSEDGLVAERPARWGVGYAPSGARAWASPLGDAWLVVTTSDAGRLPSPDEDVVRDALRALPDVQVTSTTGRADSPEGARVTATYTRRDGVRRVVLRAWNRGHLRHQVALDLPATDSRRASLVALVDDARLTPPAAVTEAARAPATSRGDVARARAASNTGDLTAAVRHLQAARDRTPNDVVAWIATLDILGEWRDARGPALADAALTRFPTDLRVTTAAAAAFCALGRSDRAAEVLRAAWTEHAGDVDLAAVAERLGVDLTDTGALRGMSPAP
jgi:membrane associated rhomboid family serine protease